MFEKKSRKREAKIFAKVKAASPPKSWKAGDEKKGKTGQEKKSTNSIFLRIDKKLFPIG